MQSFTRGWNFMLQAWKMAMADRDLLKPSLYTLLAGFIVSLVGFIPLALVGFILGTQSLPARVLLGFFGILLVFSHYAVTYIFSAMTVRLVYDFLTHGDGRMDQAWQTVQRDWGDILTLAAASTLVSALKSMFRGNGRNRNVIGGMIAGLIDTVWTEAVFLVLPIMVIEDFNLKDGLKRATYIVKNNLLLIGVSMVGVQLVTGLIGFVLVLLGIGLGLAIALSLLSLAGSAVAWITVAVLLGILTASIFFMAANIIGSYTSTAYHTCLYLWARSTEQAQQDNSQPVVPAPLAAVLE